MAGLPMRSHVAPARYDRAASSTGTAQRQGGACAPRRISWWASRAAPLWIT